MVKHNPIEIFLYENFQKTAKKPYDTIKTSVRQIDVTWNLALIHMIDYEKNKRGI